MLIDLRRPTIVIAGAFNPAIFTPEWIAAVLFQIPEGTDVEGTFVIDGSNQVARPYISGIGIAVEAGRLTIATDSLAEADLASIESIVRRVAEVLPHTPANGIGVNFHASTSDFTAKIADMVTPAEDMTTVGQLIQNELKSSVKCDQFVLNITRSITQDQLILDFNYHFQLNGIIEIINIFDGQKISALFSSFKETVNKVYEIDTEEVNFQKALAG